jgi:hypothetical protein
MQHSCCRTRLHHLLLLLLPLHQHIQHSLLSRNCLLPQLQVPLLPLQLLVQDCLLQTALLLLLLLALP